MLAVDTVASNESLTILDQAGHVSLVSPDTESVGTYLLVRHSDSDAVALWRFHPELAEMVSPEPSCGDACFDRNHQVLSIGSYLLEWGPLDKSTKEPSFPYRLLEFDPTRANPLAASAASIQDGSWTKKKFWFSRPDFGNPAGARKAYES